MTMLLLGDALMTLREALYGYKYVFERLSAGVIEGIKGIIFVFSGVIPCEIARKMAFLTPTYFKFDENWYMLCT